MTEGPRNDERERLIVGDRAGSLEPDEAAEVPLLANLLADASAWAEPGAGLEDAVVRAVMTAEPATVTAAKPAAKPAAAPTTRRARHRAAYRRGQILLAVAAAIAVVVGITVASQRGAKPDFKGELTATALAPGARASLDVTHNNGGFRIDLHASGLHPLPAGQYYQAWLKNSQGTLVPIGTFSSSDAPVTLWSGVSPQDFSVVTVTIETADNDQGSSGRRVLAGELHRS